MHFGHVPRGLTDLSLTSFRGPAVSLDLVEMQFFTSFSPSRLRVFRGISAWSRIVVLALGFTQPLSAASVALRWKPNDEKNVVGYEVIFRKSGGDFTQARRVGENARTTISGLERGKTYHFAVCAINRSGLKSAFSKEAVYRVPASFTNQAPQGRILTPSTGGTLVAGETVEFAAAGSDPDGDRDLSYRWSFGEGSGIADSTVREPGEVRFQTPGTYRVSLTVTDSRGLADSTPATRTLTVLPAWNIVPRAGWKLKYVNSEEPDGYAAVRSFDGDPRTFWHTRWTNGTTPPPHEIQIDLGVSRVIRGFQYLPRQDGLTVGSIGGFRFYVSADGRSWGSPVANGSFTASTGEKRVFSKPKRGRYVRLVCLSEVNGYNDCSVAEINLLEGPPANRVPVARSRKLTTTRNKQIATTLKGSDADANPLIYQIVTRPKHGTLSGTPPNLIYTPDRGFTGLDRLTFRIRDGRAISKTASITIRVRKPSAVKSAAVKSKSATVLSARPVVSRILVGREKYLILTIPKTALPAGAKPVVQVSSNLVDWFSGKRHTTVLADNERFLKVRDNTPLAPGKKRHIRLKTTRR